MFWLFIKAKIVSTTWLRYFIAVKKKIVVLLALNYLLAFIMK